MFAFAVISSFIYWNLRNIPKRAPSLLRELWNTWELQILVMVSLASQVILAIFGNRRKFSKKTWLSGLLWCSYLISNWVATVALGVLSINVGDIATNNGINCSHQKGDFNIQLKAFWAPFLLLHLGGPDTMSSYSLEDNELWKRQFLGLVAQTIVAIRVILHSNLHVWLLILTMPMMVAGLIKYGERTWVLRSASSEEFRDSILTCPDRAPNYHKFMQQFTLRQLEGYFVQARELHDVLPEDAVSPDGSSTICNASELIKAHKLFRTFKRLFANLILSFRERDYSWSLFEGMSYEKAFKVVEIELGFMFDILHTKAPLVCSVQGCIHRLITFSLTSIVFVLFCLLVADRQKFSMIDLSISFLLLVVAILLELFAAVSLLTSDRADLYWSKHPLPVVGRIMPQLQWLKQPARWSNSLSQYSLLSFCLYDRPLICPTLWKFFGFRKMLEEYSHITDLRVSEDLKLLIFTHIHELAKQLQEEKWDRDRVQSSAKIVLEKCGQSNLTWSTDEEFDRSVLIWHIATDICYYKDLGAVPVPNLVQQGQQKKKAEKADRERSKQLSYYMMYLHVMRPSMLPMGIGSIRYNETCTEAVRFFKEQYSTIGPRQSNMDTFQRVVAFVTGRSRESKNIFEKEDACKMLLEVNTVVPPSQVKGDRSKSVFFDACRLASQLQDIQDRAAKWEMVRKVWVEMLCYAASQCGAAYHAQQLRVGGELLTHVWLLMAHHGLTNHFQISQGHARAKLVTK